MTETFLPCDYRLPSKPEGGGYSLGEIMEAADPDLREAYEKSYSMGLAIQHLQKVVEQALADPKNNWLLPHSRQQAGRTVTIGGRGREIKFDLNRERVRVNATGDIPGYVSILRDAANDPLKMARKHVVERLMETKPWYDLTADRRVEREDAAESVTQLMMLMADNAVNHRHQQGRAA